MNDLLPLLSALVVFCFALYAYYLYRDAFHPAVFTAPLMAGGYGIWPLILNREGDLARLMGDSELAYVQTYYLVALALFYLAMVLNVRKKLPAGDSLSPWRELANTVEGKRTRARLLRLSLILGFLALAAYWSSIYNVGGFSEAYSRYKGGGYSRSGYIGEATLLAYPSAMIYALVRQGKGFRAVDWMLMLLIISPNLFQGTFGVRRGPLFISLATLFVSWIVARGRLPGIIRTGVAISMIMGAVGFVWTNRRVWFSSEPGADRPAGLASTLLPDADQLSQNDYVSGVGSAMITEYYNAFFWGKRWLVDVVIRPIPKQLWPEKYKDVGAYWKEGANPTGFSELDQLNVLGFPLPAGHSIGVLSDLYSEWWWFALIFVFLLGLFLRWLWIRHRTIGQVWTALFLAAIGLCVYLPSQSFSAWYQRFMIMAIGTMFAWRWVVGRDLRHRAEPRAAGPRSY